MRIPAKAALHAFAPHGLKARYHVLGETGQQVTIMRQAIGKRGAVIKNKLILLGPLVDRGPEGAVGLPEVKNFPVHRG